MKASLTIIVLSLFIFSCGKKSDCSSNNTGSVMIHNDGEFMPSGTADFYLGSTKIASVAKGAEVTVDNISVGPFIVTVKIGTDTIYIDEFLPDTVKQCQELHYSTDKFLPFSDKRLKKNIVSVNNVLANFDKLNVYSYEYQAPAGYTGFLPNGKHFGFMAQELKVVYPNFVQLNSNGYYSVNYQEMIPLLAKGMQEQQTQIEELKKEVAELKSLVKSQQSVAMK
ncbi:MAG: tail fiber domain-containing protein [Sphingobacteriales bacterium]|nr:tail fiber domain-containing protein [Sphingobacteriales bacterium]MBP8192068.1 tail fiber domain-containing protein [Chitinophagales bacterium]